MLRPPDLTLQLEDPTHAVPLPATHGVLLFMDRGVPVQALATAGLRGAAESKRAGGETPFDEVHAWRAGSSFEADLLSVDVMRRYLPEMLGQVAAKLGVWWLRADRERPWEGWSVVDGAGQSGETGSVVGPFPDRASAKRWWAMLDGEFELCREPAELRRAPAGTPCPYKDMGLCRATCEGGEPIAAYDARLAEAVALTVGGAERRRGELEAAMRSASAEGAFERATVLRDRLEALPGSGDRASAAVGPLDRFAFIAAVPAGRAHHARLLAVNAEGWGAIGDVDARTVGPSELGRAIASVEASSRIEPAHAGVVGREVIRPRRGGPAILPAAGLDAGELRAEVRRIAGVSPRSDAGEADVSR